MDRITILELKIKAAEKSGKEPTRFIAEKTALEEALENWKGILAEEFCNREDYEATVYKIGQEVNSLTAVNSLLWDSEDNVRELPEVAFATQDEIVLLADFCKQIATLNDKRANLVGKISALYGEKEEVHEKIYGVRLGA